MELNFDGYVRISVLASTRYVTRDIEKYPCCILYFYRLLGAGVPHLHSLMPLGVAAD